ncbi:KAP family NTPase [Aliarcobacter butzleri]|uniref:KAP family NTPase n=1 Tax=Aliarcobacter butzleri TaxID=28197 RepID=UPI0021B5B651|nr:KAP family NTPase [Aliarcobacter butzleri]MCT7566081.1 KAP family NTPase [Aliarcobacter butzleri]MDN5050417.1 KAP family NTPase [Aliarcobacter butzleri]MDN5057039.1 KAP family NTPase [Aliarcobacter butzleri]MDS1315076.1 KAP family NTPase [Aliarcobacter butzleri]
MTNQERIEEYLIAENGYLKSNISNHKIIMLSGKWGSGKTFFWKNKIIEELNKDKKIPNHYISLYGKKSIEEIENEIFLKIFESVDSFESREKAVKLSKNVVNLLSSFSSAVNFFGVNLDISKVSDKPFDKLEEILKNNKLQKTVEYLNSGAIICFDDFERKSKDIDLNDLFGFITQLTLNFSCKVVIILNDDAFEESDKTIFSNVKEKSVSKYLKYEPTIKELFEIIFGNESYKKLDEYKELILQTIQEADILNARVYIQILDNLIEWISNNQDKNENTLRSLILININFILFHIIFYKLKFDSVDIYHIENKFNQDDKNFRFLFNNPYFKRFNNFLELKKYLENNIKMKKDSSDELIRTDLKFIEDNILLIKSIYFANKLDIGRGIDDDTFTKINKFIETGIIIKEDL